MAPTRTASRWVLRRISRKSLETRRSTGYCLCSPGNRQRICAITSATRYASRSFKSPCIFEKSRLFSYSPGDGLAFPTRLVNTDVEQPPMTLQPEIKIRWSACVVRIAETGILGTACRLLIHSAAVFGPICSAADVSSSPLSESQNRLLDSEQNTNNIGGHVDDVILKSGEKHHWWTCIICIKPFTFFHQEPLRLKCFVFYSTAESDTIIYIENQS